MDIVTVKFQENVLKKLDKAITDHDYNSRTEFIREAVRDKMASLKQDKLVREFLKSREKRRPNVTVDDVRETREHMTRNLIKQLNFRLE